MKWFKLFTIAAALLLSLPAAAKDLVIYFSNPERPALPSGTDMVSSASKLLKNGRQQGTTEYVARLIQKETGADIFRIEPSASAGYPATYDELLDFSRAKQRRNARPPLKQRLAGLEQYDRVFIGYPMWWYQMPMVVYTFLESHDLSGKTIITFDTHSGYRFRKDPKSEIERIQPRAKRVVQGLSLRRSQVPNIEPEIKRWLPTLPR
ncbi:flavodoxin [Pasteurella testudinis]|uniref:flavodoxin n=1 Tax=Pasteurella testudinis TaxID=761 RepID=UPI004057E3DD